MPRPAPTPTRRPRRRTLAAALAVVVSTVAAHPAGAQDTHAEDGGAPLPLGTHTLAAAAGGAAGLGLGLLATRAVEDPCDLCWEGYVLVIGGNVLGSAYGAHLAGADHRRSLVGATIGFGAGLAVGALAHRNGVRRAPLVAVHLLTQGLVTALVERVGLPLPRGITPPR